MRGENCGLYWIIESIDIAGGSGRAGDRGANPRPSKCRGEEYVGTADSMAVAAERWDMLHDGVSMLQGAEYQRQAYELPGGPKHFVNAVDWYFYPPLRTAALLTPQYPAGDLEQVLDRTWPDGFYYRNWAAFRDFLVGVQILHDKLGITHRDLKAANLLVKEDHGGYLINDFDFATTKRTMSGQQHAGSPIYKAQVNIYLFNPASGHRPLSSRPFAD